MLRVFEEPLPEMSETNGTGVTCESTYYDELDPGGPLVLHTPARSCWPAPGGHWRRHHDRRMDGNGERARIGELTPMIRTRILFPAKENFIGESTANGHPCRIERIIGDSFCR